MKSQQVVLEEAINGISKKCMRTGFAKYDLKDQEVLYSFVRLWSFALKTSIAVAEFSEHDDTALGWIFWWLTFAHHPYKLKLVANQEQVDKKQLKAASEIEEQEYKREGKTEKSEKKSTPGKLTAVLFQANVFSAVDLNSKTQRQKLWDHLNIDQGKFLKAFRNQYMPAKKNAQAQVENNIILKILNTPWLREEFAQKCQQLQAIILNLDHVNDEKKELDAQFSPFILPERIPLKSFCQRGKGKDKFYLPDKDTLPLLRTTIIQQLKTKEYYAGQYWMQFRKDKDRFNLLFTDELQAHIIAQVNLADSNDRKLFYHYLGQRHLKSELSLLQLLNGHGGLFATEPYWSSLAKVLRVILQNKVMAEELFSRYPILARQLNVNDIDQLAKNHKPNGANPIREILRPRKWYEIDWYHGYSNWFKIEKPREKDSKAVPIVSPESVDTSHFFHTL